MSARFLAMGWRWIVAGLALGVAVGWLVGWRHGVVRRAQATVMALGPATAAGVGESVAAARNVAEVQAAALRSWPCLEQATRTAPDAVQQALAYELAQGQQPPLALRRRLKVTAGADTGLVTLALESSHVDAACALVNAVVDAHVARQRDGQLQTRAILAREISGELARQQAALAAAEQRHAAFLRDHPSASAGLGAAAVADHRLADLQQAAARAETEAALAQAEAAIVRAHIEATPPGSRLPMPHADEASQRQVAAIRERADAASLQLRQLLAEVTAVHPAAAQLRRSAEELRAEADAAADRLSQTVLRAKEQEAKRRQLLVGTWMQRLSDERRRLADADPELAEGQALEAAVLRARRLVDGLYERQHALGLEGRIDAQGAGARSVAVLERATQQASPVVASMAGAVAAGGFAGVLAGALLAFIRVALRPRAAGGADLEGIAPLLAQAPLWNGGEDVADALRTPAMAQSGLLLHTALASVAASPRVVLLAPLARDPWLQGAAATLAATAAAGGRATMLFDADRRHRDAHSPFPRSASLEPGGRSGGTGRAQPGRAGLCVQGVAAHGDGLEGHAALAAALRALEAARRDHDFVVVDAPPLRDGAVMQVLAAHSDGVVLLLRQGCLLSEVEEAVRRLARCGITVLGAWLHGPDRVRASESTRPRAAAMATSPEPGPAAALRSGGPA